MALTKSRLQQIIREETNRILKEQRYRDPEDYVDQVLSKMTDEELESALKNPDDRSIIVTIEEILLDLGMYHGDASQIAYNLYDLFRKGDSYRAEAKRRRDESDEDYDDYEDESP